DHPLVSEALIEKLIAAHTGERAAATILTTRDLDPAGYGRILRGANGSIERIVETKYPDQVPAELLEIREINIGTYAFEGPDLLAALERVEPRDGEVQLTETFPILTARGSRVAAHETSDLLSALGVNSRVELMEAERLAQRGLIEDHARAGVT